MKQAYKLKLNSFYLITASVVALELSKKALLSLAAVRLIDTNLSLDRLSPESIAIALGCSNVNINSAHKNTEQITCK